MAIGQMSEVVRHIRRTALLQDAAGLTDGQLLGCFVEHRDEAALAALVRRHGPMVWSVCRRVLGNHHDAEDAFQATFLVLVRKAGSVSPREMVANWLYGVARQTALKARGTTGRRSVRERQVISMPEPAAAEPDLWRDLLPLLDEELSLLPDKYRVAIVLCDLESKTRKEAAQQLGCPEGTLAARVARGRVMLAKRLARRGIVLSGGLLAAVLTKSAASACVPPSVVSSTIKAARLFAAGQAAGVISVKVAALTEGVLKTMLLNKLKLGAVIGLLILAVSVGAGVGISTLPASGQEKQRVESQAPQPLPSKDKGENKEQGRIFFLRQKGVGEETSLAMVSPDGKGDTSLTKNLKLEQQPSQFTISPDGRQVAYGVRAPGDNSDPTNYEVFLKAVDNEQPGDTLKVQGSVWCWSPDSRSLAVTTFKDGVVAHEIVDVKTKKTKPLQLPEGKAPGDAEGPVGHVITDWSKDGKWLLTTLYLGWAKADIYRMKSDGSEAKRIGTGLDGKLSPDGKKVLYQDWKDDETPDKGQLFVADMEGGKPQRVSQESNGKFTGGYCWSPDGKKIAYVWQRDRDADSQEWEAFLMVMDADGKNSTVVLCEKLTSTHNYVSILYPDWR